MDLGGMPMQTDASGLQNPPASNAQPQTQRTNAFGQNVFMGVSRPQLSAVHGKSLTSLRLTQRQVMVKVTQWAL